MRLRRLVAAIFFALGGIAYSENSKSPPADQVVPGSALQNGMELVYASNGRRSDPWHVESIQTGLRHGGRSGCTRIELKYPDEADPEVRWQCRAGKMLYSFNSKSQGWEASRPLGERMGFESRNPDGVVTARYETGKLSFEMIDGLEVGVIKTVVYTLSKEGAVTRRLRERYATALGTATGGIFEVPDSSRQGGWKKTSEFELAEIRRNRKKS